MKKHRKKTAPRPSSILPSAQKVGQLKKRMSSITASSKRMLANRPHLRRRKSEIVIEEAIQAVPRITNETVAEHREAVLSSARKYIYPLRHSSHKIVTISVSLFVVVVVLFFSYCMLAL